MKVWLGVVVILAAALVARAADRPNLVFILTDDQRWDCLSAAGHPFVKTPNIDRIAAEGAYFNNAFVTIPLCSPSRACFLTGKYSHSNGVINNTNAMAPISHTLDTFYTHLRDGGYETAMIGKLHMGLDDSPRPGFDHWAVFKGQGRYIDCPLNINGTETPIKGYVTDVLTDKTVEFIRKDHGGKPFALWLGHKAVHGPYRPADRHKDLYSTEALPQRPDVKDVDNKGKPALTRKVADPPKDHPAYGVTDDIVRNQLRCLAAVDESVGRVLKTLEETGQLDNTLVVFASDNGYLWNEHHLGDKRVAYEESIRIPLVMRYPKLIKPGTKVDQMVLNIDLAPTVLELAGARPIENVHGKSLVPLFKGDASAWRQSALLEYFLEKQYPNVETWQGVRTADWKYIHYTDLKDMDELYDLKNDPYEMNNVIADPANAKQLDTLKSELKKLLDEAT
jgi:N-acetylglucosamine-6-sulfatase